MTDNNRSILIIEDNKEVLDTIKSVLEYLGYSSEGVRRFDESVFDQLKTGKYNLIILDVMLSGDDGRDLARKFKSTEETKAIPILMISAYPKVASSVKAAGADDFLAKSFGVQELREKVEQFL